MLVNLGGFLPIIALSIVGVILLAIIGFAMKRMKILQTERSKRIITKI